MNMCVAAGLFAEQPSHTRESVRILDSRERRVRVPDGSVVSREADAGMWDLGSSERFSQFLQRQQTFL